eukprot:m.76958 g.76958  ORF g.76958 m.76958 type:complete len:898 (-) comp24959_c0_seq1:84-2777(-)
MAFWVNTIAFTFVFAIANAAPAIDWGSSPVFADQTALLLGGTFTNESKVTIAVHTSNSTVSGVVLDVIQASEGSIKFIIPKGMPAAQWDVTVDGSASHTLNAPVLWWVHGDQTRTATPGGHLRVLGNCVHYDSAQRKAAKANLEKAKMAMSQAIESVEEDASAAIITAVQRLTAAQTQYNTAASASASILRLTPIATSMATTTAPIILSSFAANSTAWSAWFDVPTDLQPGEYTVELANSLAPTNFIKLESFISPAEPKVSTVSVVSPTQLAVVKPWTATDAKVFRVGDYGAYGLPPVSGVGEWVNASVAIQKAIDAAAAAGGGTVFFDRGTYFVNSSYGFTIPWGVRLQGEGKELVEIIFSQMWNVSDTGAVKPGSAASGALALFRGPEVGAGAWAVSNLTVYVTGFHNIVFYVNNRTRGFEMTECRVTADSFLGNTGPHTARDHHSNWTWGLNDNGALLNLQGSEYLVEDNDLYSDSAVITSTTGPNICPVQMNNKTVMAHCHGSMWGTIRNNRIYNSGPSHFMAQWKQIIFEQNQIVGVSVVAGGQSLGTGPGGGYAHHVYHHANRIQFVWGGDREIVTFDDAGAAYLGAVEAVSADGLTITLKEDARTSVSGEWGGWDGSAVTVLNGTGVGTWRRVVRSGIDATDNAGEWFNAHNRTWVIDRPFPFAITKGQIINITPARARVIFEGDNFVDGGTLQFYGQAQECTVQSLVGERITGTVAWGQWRGWYKPPCGTMGMPPCMLGGEMGNGIMMNTQLSYLDNHITVGNKIVRFGAQNSEGQYGQGYAKFYNGATFNIQGVNIETQKPCQGPCRDWSQLAATTAVVFRGNVVDNNGGFNIGNAADTPSIRDVIIEGNTIKQSDADKAMQISPVMVNRSCIVRNNILPPNTTTPTI